tara:strand:- start:332 stop:592 length:261 start_codon:yes stop_codon:yes gene_type:complete
MKKYIQNQDVVIEYSDYVKEKNPQVGDVIEHFNKVHSFIFYERDSRTKNKYKRIELSKSFITELYNEMMGLESKSTNKPYEEDLLF